MDEKKREHYRRICENLNLSPAKMSNEYLFTLWAVDLFYYKNNIGQIDIRTGFVDGKNDGGIDFIYSDNDTLFLIQGKSSKNLSFEEVKNVFYKIVETVNNFEDKHYDQYSDLLISSYRNAYDDLNEDKNIEIVLFTQTEFVKDVKGQFEEFAKGDNFKNYKLSLYDINDIIARDAMLFQESDLVNEDSLAFFNNSNNENNKNSMLCYGENGIIVNARASSIKRLYEKYGRNGLFSYNLREHITQKSVDDAINETIKKERDRFWFYNNGITIGCTDFYVDGNKIKLYNFSIINGAQTTTKIGQSELVNVNEDFAVVCKVVRAQVNRTEDEDFISKISEASNSQKPIKPRDLKANSKEQKILQAKCAKNIRPLAIEIKRGVKPKNYHSVDKWQRVTNEFVGQLIYACILQKPGPARSNKNTIFSSEKVYSQIFRNKYESDTIYDLVKLSFLYDNFSEAEFAKNLDVDKIAIISNGKLTTLAVVVYLFKLHNSIVADRNSDELHKFNVFTTIISGYRKDDFEQKIYSLFGFIIRIISKLYETKKESMRITSCSNFFKSEDIYDDLVLKEFDLLDDYDKEKLGNYLEIFC